MTAVADTARSDDLDDLPPRRTRRRRLVAIGCAAVVLAGLVVWVVAFSPLLGVRTVRVLGVHQLTAARVERAADIAHGSPLLRLNTGAIAARVESIAEVESATVTTSLPSTVTITVHERTPVGWLTFGDKYAIVDHTGVRYRTLSKRPTGLPQLQLPANASTATTAAAAQVAAALPRDLLPRIASIQAMDPQAITLVMRNQAVVRWGTSALSADKARLVPLLLRPGVTEVDVSDPDHPYTRTS